MANIHGNGKITIGNEFPMVFRFSTEKNPIASIANGCPNDFPVIVPGFSYGFPMIFLCLSHLLPFFTSLSRGIRRRAAIPGWWTRPWTRPRATVPG